jgi:hypothetical protein
VFGGTVPDKLAQLLRESDDGLLARCLWFWPDPVPFRLSEAAPRMEWALAALDRLRRLILAPTAENEMRPQLVRLAESARPAIQAFARKMQQRQHLAGGLLASAYGKARGQVLRLSLVLEYFWWCAQRPETPPPTEISEAAFDAARDLVDDYFMPMAEQVYGDAACRDEDRNAATIARWISRTKAEELHVRTLLRKRPRLPDLNSAKAIHSACAVLVEAGWLIPPKVGYGAARKVAYAVNMLVHEPAEATR